MELGEEVSVAAYVELGGLEPNEAAVELYHGVLSSQGEFIEAARTAMSAAERKGRGWEYRATVACDSTGQRGYAVRVLPKHPALVSPFVPGLVRWA